MNRPVFGPQTGLPAFALHFDTLNHPFVASGILCEDKKLTCPEQMFHHLSGCLLDENPALYKQVSPLYYVGPHCLPSLLLHGESDYWSVEYVQQCVRLWSAVSIQAA